MTEDTSLREKVLRAKLRAELRKWPDNADISIDGLYVITAGELAAILDASEAKDRRIEALEAALTPFAECASEWDGEPDSLHVFLEWNDDKKPVPSLPVADFRRARAALSGKEGQS